MSSRFTKFDNKIKEILNKDNEVRNFELIDEVYKNQIISRGEKKAFYSF